MRIKNRSHAKAENDVFFLFQGRPQRSVLAARNCRRRTADKRKGASLHGNALYDCILPTLCERGEWCRFFFFKVARKGAYLPYVTAAGVPRTKGKAHPYTETPCMTVFYQLCASAESGADFSFSRLPAKARTCRT